MDAHLSVWGRLGVVIGCSAVLPALGAQVDGSSGAWASAGYALMIGGVLCWGWRRRAREALRRAYEEGRADAMREGGQAACLARAYQQGYVEGRRLMIDELRGRLSSPDLAAPAPPSGAGPQPPAARADGSHRRAGYRTEQSHLPGPSVSAGID